MKNCDLLSIWSFILSVLGFIASLIGIYISYRISRKQDTIEVDHMYYEVMYSKIDDTLYNTKVGELIYRQIGIIKRKKLIYHLYYKNTVIIDLLMLQKLQISNDYILYTGIKNTKSLDNAMIDIVNSTTGNLSTEEIQKLLITIMKRNYSIIHLRLNNYRSIINYIYGIELNYLRDTKDYWNLLINSAVINNIIADVYNVANDIMQKGKNNAKIECNVNNWILNLCVMIYNKLKCTKDNGMVKLNNYIRHENGMYLKDITFELNNHIAKLDMMVFCKGNIFCINYNNKLILTQQDKRRIRVCSNILNLMIARLHKIKSSELYKRDIIYTGNLIINRLNANKCIKTISKHRETFSKDELNELYNLFKHYENTLLRFEDFKQKTLKMWEECK